MTMKQFDKAANIELAVDFLERASRARSAGRKWAFLSMMEEAAYHRAKAMEARG